ncbi:hypothetical protein JCM10213_008507 [Rhodosporidiobolus nylandii]
MSFTNHDPSFHPVYVPAYPPIARTPPSTASSHWRSSVEADGQGWSRKSDKEGRPLVRYSLRTVQTSQTTLRRQLKSRHIAVISLGGVIGTGLFLGSAQSLQKAGPLGLLLAFSLMGVWVWCMMISLFALSA